MILSNILLYNAFKINIGLYGIFLFLDHPLENGHHHPSPRMCPKPLPKCFSGTRRSWASTDGSGCRRFCKASQPWWSTFQIPNACNRNATSFPYGLQRPLGIMWILQSSNLACYRPCGPCCLPIGIRTTNLRGTGCLALTTKLTTGIFCFQHVFEHLLNYF